LIQQNIVTNFGCLADDHSFPMVDKKSPADFGAGMDFDAS
jgi:hypothetical protein